jgi:ribosomal protein L10
MPKQLQTVVRQGRKVLANLWLKEILTTRDACFFFQPPSLDGGTTLEMKQKFHSQLGMTWRHIRPKVSRHYLESGPYRELQRLMQGPVMVAFSEEAKDRAISTKQVRKRKMRRKWDGLSVDRSIDESCRGRLCEPLCHPSLSNRSPFF